MRYFQLCEVYEELEKNPSRLKKTEILAEFLKKLKREKKSDLKEAGYRIKDER